LRAAVTKLDIVIPGPEIDDDPAAISLWNETGNFIGTALARMEWGRAAMTQCQNVASANGECHVMIKVR
jgi:hypothetical protein